MDREVRKSFIYKYPNTFFSKNQILSDQSYKPSNSKSKKLTEITNMIPHYG